MERIGCSNQEECRLRDSLMGCREDVHHTQYPRRDYKKGIARVFRELDENKVKLCRALHDEIHATQPPPEMPSIEVMQQAVLNARLNREGGNETAA